MSNYTTQTATLKATTIDTRKIDAKQIDTKKLFINGELFDPSQIKESPNVALFAMLVQDTIFQLQSIKSNQDGESIFQMEDSLLKGSETEGALPNGVYAVIQIDDNFAKCISENYNDEAFVYMLSSAKFTILNFTEGIKIEECIFENFITNNTDGQSIWVIKIYEEDDDLTELFEGLAAKQGGFMWFVSIPYYIPENDTSSSSTYSLRKTNLFDSLREKFEQMRQQNLDNSTE